MKHFHIRRGAPPIRQAPSLGDRGEFVSPSGIAFVGEDFPGLRPRFAVEPGQEVAVGDVLFSDRRHPEVLFVSPISGVVAETAFGPRRTLSICRVEAAEVEKVVNSLPSDSERMPREFLLSSGHWPSFRTRPFGRVPSPDTSPDAIIMNAVQVLPEQGEDLDRGISILTRLTEGPVYIAQPKCAPVGPDNNRLVRASFDGTAAAALPGTQIDCLCSVGVGDRTVLTVDWQDVAAMGRQARTGQYDPLRSVLVSDTEPHRVRVPLGARLADIMPINGAPVLSGGRAALFLGRYHDEVRRDPELRRKPAKVVDAIIPTRGLAGALAPDVLTIPLLKALSIGDAERAFALGCLGLIEEDVAEATARCSSGMDYGRALRHVLDELMDDAA